MRGGIHHLDLVVSSLERSLPFYRDLLEPLGYTRVGTVEGERGETIWYHGGAGGAALGIREAQSAGDFDRYRIGVHHVAFEAASREVVEERHRWALGRGVEIESPPKEYTYAPGCYALGTGAGVRLKPDTSTVSHPDGIKLEVVHVPTGS